MQRASRPSGRRALRQAWESSGAELARRQLLRLAASLDAEHPGAAASLREGLEETLTLLGLERHELEPGVRTEEEAA